jgi:hypothetical protein
MEEIKVIKEFLGERLRGIFCDVSGGPEIIPYFFRKK